MVDDDRLILSTVSQGLTQAGYQVRTAESVAEAEELLSAGQRPHLVLLDLHLPGDEGLCLADSLRDLDNLPFLVFSAYSDARTVERATQAGALGYLVKPLDVRHMVPAIEAALVRSRELNTLRSTGEQLQTALDLERDISVAVGITMAEHRLSRDQAFKRLRAAARSQRRRLADVAAELIRSLEVMHRT
jgi:response regulator NasT